MTIPVTISPCDPDPALDGITDAPPQTPAAPDSERVRHAEQLLADDEAGAANDAPAAAHSAPSATGLHSARAELAQLNRQLANASAALRRAQEPVTRLRQLIADGGDAETELETRQRRHLGELGDWLAGGGNPDLRPTPSPELLAAEQHYLRCQRDAEAARRVIGDHESEVAKASRLVTALTGERDRALRAAALEIAAQFVDGQLVPAIRAVRLLEKCCWDLADSFTQAGDSQTGARVGEVIRDGKSRAPVPAAEPHRGRAFLDALLQSPSEAQLAP